MSVTKARTTTKVSSRGQVVLPASMRASKDRGPGTELEVIDRGNEVVLRKRSRREELYPPITMEEFLRRLPKYDGPSFTDEEIENALNESVREEWRRETGRRYQHPRPLDHGRRGAAVGEGKGVGRT